MSFITAAQVASYSGLTAASISQGQIDAAEAAVAAYIGAETLELTEYTDVMYTGISATKLLLPHGPLASIDNVDSIEIDGEEVTLTSVYRIGYWMLSYPTGVFPTATKIELVYSTGWDPDDSDGLPTNIMKALLMTCANISKNPVQGFKSESIGDYSYTLGDGGWAMIDAMIPPAAQLMLNPYRNPDLLF